MLLGAVVWDVKGSDCGPAQEEPHPRSAVGENFRVEVWGSKHILLGGGGEGMLLWYRGADGPSSGLAISCVGGLDSEWFLLISGPGPVPEHFLAGPSSSCPPSRPPAPPPLRPPSV